VELVAWVMQGGGNAAPWGSLRGGCWGRGTGQTDLSTDGIAGVPELFRWGQIGQSLRRTLRQGAPCAGIWRKGNGTDRSVH